MAAAYPPLHLEPDTFEVWHQTVLEATDFDTGDRAARWIVVNDQRFPTPARFREVLRMVRRPVDTHRAIDEGEPVGNVERERWLSACRRIVRPAP